MKILEIINESKELDEVSPTSLKTAAGFKQIGNKILGAFGVQSAKAKGDVGTRAKELYKAFNDYALRTGVPMNRVPVTTLINWTKTQGLTAPTTKFNSQTVNLSDPKMSLKIWTSIAQDAYRAAYDPDKLGLNYGVPRKAVNEPAATTQATPTVAVPAQSTASAQRGDKIDKIINIVKNLPPQQKAQIMTALNPQ